MLVTESWARRPDRQASPSLSAELWTAGFWLLTVEGGFFVRCVCLRWARLYRGCIAALWCWRGLSIINTILGSQSSTRWLACQVSGWYSYTHTATEWRENEASVGWFALCLTRLYQLKLLHGNFSGIVQNVSCCIKITEIISLHQSGYWVVIPPSKQHTHTHTHTHTNAMYPTNLIKFYVIYIYIHTYISMNLYSHNNEQSPGDHTVYVKDKWSLKPRKHTCTDIQTYTHIHTHMHTYIHACMHAYIHTHIQTCMHTYTHTYMHAYIQT